MKAVEMFERRKVEFNDSAIVSRRDLFISEQSGTLNIIKLNSFVPQLLKPVVFEDSSVLKLLRIYCLFFLALFSILFILSALTLINYR